MSGKMRARERLSPTEFTLLGLIERATEPDTRAIHGYDLNRRLTSGAIGEIIRIEPGMIYHYLKKLAKHGLITTTIVPQEGKPDRHLHAISRAGRERFEMWLAEPVQATREMRLDFLLKLWFAKATSQKRADALVHDQRVVLQGLIASLEQQRIRVTDASGDGDFARQVIDLRLAQNRAALAWLEALDEK